MLGKEYPLTLMDINDVGSALSKQGKYTKAEKIHRDELALSKKLLRKEHPGTLTSMFSVAEVLREQGKYMEAEKIYQNELALSENVPETE
jgi:hypothetical protein